MSHTKLGLPAAHPFRTGIAAQMSPFELAAAAVEARRGWSGGLSMKKPDDDDGDGDGDGDDDDPLELDPEDKVKVGDKVMTVAQLQRIAATEKRQGKKAGQKSLLEQAGFDTVEELLAALAKVPKEDKPKGGDDGDDEARRQRERREQEDREEREKQRRKTRSLDLRGALRDAGVPRADLDAGEALLDRLVDSSYDDDDLDDAIEQLRETRAGRALFEDDDDEGDQGKGEKRTPAARIPQGRPKGKPKPPAKPFGAAGVERAKRKGWIKADS